MFYLLSQPWPQHVLWRQCLWRLRTFTNKMLTINKLSHSSSYNMGIFSSSKDFLLLLSSSKGLENNSAENLWTRKILLILHSVQGDNYYLSLTCKISAIWFVVKSIILAVLYSRPRYCTLWGKTTANIRILQQAIMKTIWLKINQ